MYAGNQPQQRRPEAHTTGTAAHQLHGVQRVDDTLHGGTRQIDRQRYFAQAHAIGLGAQRIEDFSRTGNDLNTAGFFIITTC
ncbi:hypothetical protein D3C78_881710 [compost metagenome]